MILRTPSYYDDFKCIADKCTDNCCIGWEIDIDEITAEKYFSIGGEFGERLKSSVTRENPSFIPDEKGRCPFLNKDNLCDIILHSGEDMLCDICSNHPRYFEWFGDVKEGGTGLSCEESARIILSSEFSVSERKIPDEETDFPDEKIYGFLTAARDKIIAYLTDENIPLENALSDISRYGNALQNALDSEEFSIPEIKSLGEEFSPDIKKGLDFLLTLEKLSPDWEPYIVSMRESVNSDEKIFVPKTDKYLRNIAVYFIWRYFLKSVYDGEITPKINLMATSVCLLSFLFSKSDFSLENCSFIAKNFSKEIEYSDENVDELSYFCLL